jgi:hypothetical protein
VDITQETLRVDDERVLELVDGLASPAAFVDHVSPVLRAKLEAIATQGRAQAESLEINWEEDLGLAVDRHVPFLTLADTMFTAWRVGFREIELELIGPHGLHAITLTPPRAWLPPDRLDGPVGEREETPSFRVHSDRIELEFAGETRVLANLADCSSVLEGCLDRASLAREIAAAHAAAPKRRVADFLVDGDIPLQTLVELLDLARGDCSSPAGIDGQPPEGCYYFHPIVDLAPGLFWNLGRDFVFDAPRARRGPSGSKGGPRAKQLLALYEAHADEVEACFREAKDQRLLRELDEDGGTIGLMFGPEGMALFLGLGGDPRAPEIAACVAARLETEVVELSGTSTFMSTYQSELAIPVRLVERDTPANE